MVHSQPKAGEHYNNDQFFNNGDNLEPFFRLLASESRGEYLPIIRSQVKSVEEVRRDEVYLSIRSETQQQWNSAINSHLITILTSYARSKDMYSL